MVLETIDGQLDDFGMVSYVEFSNRDEELMNRMLLETDALLQVRRLFLQLGDELLIVQYGEDLDIEDHLPQEWDQNEMVD